MIKLAIEVLFQEVWQTMDYDMKTENDTRVICGQTMKYFKYRKFHTVNTEYFTYVNLLTF